LSDELEKFKKSEEGKDFWGARMIWTTIRAFDKKAVIESMYKAHESGVNSKLTNSRHESMHRHEARVP
jgi:hypothetical protein